MARALACALTAGGPIACASGAAHTTTSARPIARLRTPAGVGAAAWGGRAVSRVEELLDGYVPGVTVVATGGGYAVRVRGATSLVGTAEPLYVVDGLPLATQEPRTLAGLNPADVLRIEVLKDAADLTFYGLRGAHGVIRITTKRSRAR